MLLRTDADDSLIETAIVLITQLLTTPGVRTYLNNIYNEMPLTANSDPRYDPSGVNRHKVSAYIYIHAPNSVRTLAGSLGAFMAELINGFVAAQVGVATYTPAAAVTGVATPADVNAQLAKLFPAANPFPATTVGLGVGAVAVIPRSAVQGLPFEQADRVIIRSKKGPIAKESAELQKQIKAKFPEYFPPTDCIIWRRVSLRVSILSKTPSIFCN